MLLEASRRPCLQIAANLLRTRFSSGNDDMDVIRPTIHGMEKPPALTARFRDLSLDGVALLGIQSARILAQPGSGPKLAHRIGQLPATAVFDPASGIAR